ncbi:MAG: Swt1 family HEPN domain-containing protein [Planctomycetaceae bacterium]
MSTTNHERVASALQLLTEGMAPFVEERLRAVHGDRWRQAAQASFRDDRARSTADGQGIAWDAHALLTVMWDQWNASFRTELGHAERSLVSELREFRNRWAHQQAFDFDDTYRILDSVRRLLAATNSPRLAEIQEQKQDLLESHVAEQVNTQLNQVAFKRNKWWVIAIYAICCVVLIGFLIAYGNSGTPAVITVLSLLFVYLVYQQFKLEPPLLYGPRECSRCHRIIYRKNCPYCSPDA